MLLKSDRHSTLIVVAVESALMTLPSTRDISNFGNRKWRAPNSVVCAAAFAAATVGIRKATATATATAIRQARREFIGPWKTTVSKINRWNALHCLLVGVGWSWNWAEGAMRAVGAG